MRITSRLAAIGAGASLVAAGLVATPAQAAVPDPTPADQAASWILKQGFFSAGAQIDVLQQLKALGKSADADLLLAQIKAGAADYATLAEAKAKVVYAGDLMGQDANTWGAGDLVQGVADGVDDASGRIEGAYVTPASQALAVRALGNFNGRTSDPEYGMAHDFLLRQQCDDGGYRDALDTTTCQADHSAGSPDATAFVVLYLEGTTDPELRTSLARAKDWLAQTQRADGSWQSAPQAWGPGVPNANSTGLAALAVGAGSPESIRAAAWLRRLQARDAGTCSSKFGADKGAIAYTAEDYEAGRTGGLDEGQYTRGSWVYATQQSLAVLKDAPGAGGALSLTGATAYVKAGSVHGLAVRNVAPYSQACLTGHGVEQDWEANATGASNRSVRMPAGTAHRSYRIVDSAGRVDSHVFRVLGRKTFDIRKDKSRVRKTKYQHVLIKGLAPRERINVYYNGKRIRHTYASATGVYATKFRVGHSTGRKKLVIKGQFGDIRQAVRYFRVVR